jgi:predicted dehydrogenase
MKTNRRNFLRTAAVAGAAACAGNALAGCAGNGKDVQLPEIEQSAGRKYSQRFNMSGYCADPIDRVRVGLIGLGDRGSGAVKRLIRIEGVEVVALADLRQNAVDLSQRDLAAAGLPAAMGFAGDDYAWKGLCDLENVDLVYICSPWIWHTPMALYAMEQGKHVAVEIPAARTIDDAWQLVETSERTRRHCMMLENCCYDFFEMLTRNMARQGMFGDLIHGEGAYIHNLMGYNFKKPIDDRQSDGAYTGMWRLRENASRNGCLYPTHGLGPICQIMNINRGDRMEYLTSMSTNDFGMKERANELAASDEFYAEFRDRNYRGNMNTSLIRTALGRTIMIQHDVTSIRPYSRIHLVSGTLGMAVKYPSERIALGHSWVRDDELAILRDQHAPEIIKRVGDMARQVGGHGGMDFIMDWRLIDCLRNGLPVDQDVYDAASWSSVGPLSEWSVANRSASIEIPDFTCGKWRENKPHEINLEHGGNTGVLELKTSRNNPA